MTLIPTDARRAMCALRESVDETIFLDAVWLRRYPLPSPAAKGAWPFVRAADRPAEARVNVSKLSIRRS